MRASSGTRWTSVGLILGLGVALVPACGSEDPKKKIPPAKYNGNDLGAGASAGGGSARPDDGGAHPDGGNAQLEGGTGSSSGATGGTLGESGSATKGDAGSAATHGSSAGASAGDGCPLGYDDCDDDPSDCETPVNTLTQCGGCAISCSDEQGTVECTEGKCVMTSCTKGYGDCDNDGTTGCELALAEDDAHCGDCLRDCAAAGSTCNTSMCTPITVASAISGFASFMTGRSVYFMTGGYTLSLLQLDGGTKKQIWAATASVGSTLIRTRSIVTRPT